MTNLNEFMIYDLNKRIKKLEEKVFKNKRPIVTMGKKLLLLRETDLINSISQMFKTKEDLYLFLSICLDEDIANIKKYLNDRKLIEIDDNYSFVAEQFSRLKFQNKTPKIESLIKKYSKKE